MRPLGAMDMDMDMDMAFDLAGDDITLDGHGRAATPDVGQRSASGPVP
jgi:hypothetical protein